MRSKKAPSAIVRSLKYSGYLFPFEVFWLLCTCSFICACCWLCWVALFGGWGGICSVNDHKVAVEPPPEIRDASIKPQERRHTRSTINIETANDNHNRLRRKFRPRADSIFEIVQFSFLDGNPHSDELLSAPSSSSAAPFRRITAFTGSSYNTCEYFSFHSLILNRLSILRSRVCRAMDNLRESNAILLANR